MTTAFNLALQGGGSHGAFTWGVLDRLLEEPDIAIAGMTGASAGAMNAVVVADGHARGGKEGAREALDSFWNAVAREARFSPIQRSPLDHIMGDWTLDRSPGLFFFDMMSRAFSPYDLNPFDAHPLRDVLEREVDFDRIRKADCFGVFISATNVETGRARVFERGELTVDHVLASACLPMMFQATEIDGAHYWDGGFMGNPPLWPLFEHSACDDVLIIQINPLKRAGPPRSARDIADRLNEITFNASLLRELRALDFVSRLLDAGRLEGTGYRNVFVHMVGDEPTLAALGASSKLNAEAAFLTMLKEKGRAAADGWLAAHKGDVGVRSSLDLDAVFEGDHDALDGARISRAAAFQKRADGGG